MDIILHLGGSGKAAGEQLMLTKNFHQLQAEVQRHVAAESKAAAAASAYVADSALFAARARQATALADGDPILSRRRQRDTLLKLIKEAPMETN